MITHDQLRQRVLEGHFILVGEYRNGRLQFREIVDHRSGERIQTAEYVYAVECGTALGTVMIYRPCPPPPPGSTAIGFGLEKGRRYAFELDRFTRKGGFVTAHLGSREPELVTQLPDSAVNNATP